MGFKHDRDIPFSVCTGGSINHPHSFGDEFPGQYKNATPHSQRHRDDDSHTAHPACLA